MMETKHTPGPWTFEIDDSGVYHIKAPGHPGSLFCDEQYYPWCSNNEADWHLLAAAPEMFEALKLALDAAESWIHDHLDGTRGLDLALAELQPCRDALAKASPINYPTSREEK